MKEPVRKAPLVSIGLPVFNGGAYLERTLDSILNQTYRNMEIVIRDNCSTDNTCEIVSEYAKRDQRINFLRASHNEGAARNYNAVCEQASGDYFKWAAADDLLAPTFVERCVSVLEQSPGCVLAYPKTDIIDASGNTVVAIDDELVLDSEDPITRYKVIRSSLKECNAVFGVMRSEVLRRTHLIQPYMAADMHLLAELVLYGRFVEIPERLFFRRDHESASSADPTEAAQAVFYDPKRAGRPLMSSWNGLLCDFKSVVRAPVSAMTKLKLMAFLLRFFYWHSRDFRYDLFAYFKYRVRRITGSGGVGHASKID